MPSYSIVFARPETSDIYPDFDAAEALMSLSDAIFEVEVNGDDEPDYPFPHGFRAAVERLEELLQETGPLSPADAFLVGNLAANRMQDTGGDEPYQSEAAALQKLLLERGVSADPDFDGGKSKRRWGRSFGARPLGGLSSAAELGQRAVAVLDNDIRARLSGLKGQSFHDGGLTKSRLDELVNHLPAALTGVDPLIEAEARLIGEAAEAVADIAQEYELGSNLEWFLIGRGITAST